jgi:hypothetical protein
VDQACDGARNRKGNLVRGRPRSERVAGRRRPVGPVRRRFSQRGANWDGRRVDADLQPLLLQPKAPRAATHSDALHGRPAEPLNVTLAHLATSPSNVTLPAQTTFLIHPRLGRQGRRSTALRGAGTVGDPPGRLVPRLTIRPPLLALAALAPLTASSGGGIGLPAPDVGPTGLGPHPTSGALSRSTMAVGVRYPTGSQQGP